MNIDDQNRECHAERSEASRCPSREILRFAQDDKLLPVSLVKNHHRGPPARHVWSQNDGHVAERRCRHCWMQRRLSTSSGWLSCPVERGYCTDGFFCHRTQYRSCPRHCQVFILISSTIIKGQNYIFYREQSFCLEGLNSRYCIQVNCFVPRARVGQNNASTSESMSSIRLSSSKVIRQQRLPIWSLANKFMYL